MEIGEAHVWTVSLAQGGELADLDDDERACAARFHFDADRRRYLAAHTALSRILTKHLGAPRGRYVLGPRGKPRLLDGDLRFNLSHSGELALVALTRGRECGVDLERIRPLADLAEVARRYFSPHEVGALFALPPSERTLAFYRVWTRKESYIKARGDGLSLPLDSFDVTLEAGDARLLRCDADDVARWTMVELPVAAGYAAALCVEGALESVQRFDY